MNIHHLRYFEEVCNQGSITKAAEICHVSQPSITAAINGLEQEFGFKLFHRVNNRLQITDEGQRFLEMTQDFLAVFDCYYETAKDLDSNRKSIIRLGVPSVMGTFFFQKIIPEFENTHPDIALKVFEIPTISGIKMLNKANLDFLLGINTESCYTNCDSKFIFSTNLVFAISKDHPLSHERLITSEMLSGQPLVLISKGSYHYTTVTEAFQDIDLNVIMHSSQLSTIQYMVSGNHAATIIYKDVFTSDPDIRCIPLERAMPANVHVFWQKNTYLSAAMRKFIKYITSLKF